MREIQTSFLVKCTRNKPPHKNSKHNFRRYSSFRTDLNDSGKFEYESRGKGSFREIALDYQYFIDTPLIVRLNAVLGTPNINELFPTLTTGSFRVYIDDELFTSGAAFMGKIIGAIPPRDNIPPSQSLSAVDEANKKLERLAGRLVEGMINLEFEDIKEGEEVLMLTETMYNFIERQKKKQ